MRRSLAASKRPNLLIICGDDIGWFNISAYNHGILGHRTPSIDRIAREGALFTDWYGQQSCPAGRAPAGTVAAMLLYDLAAVALPHSARFGAALPGVGLSPTRRSTPGWRSGASPVCERPGRASPGVTEG